MQLFAMLMGALIGAGIMYLLDPQGGGRRRALLRDQMEHYRHEMQETAVKRADDLSNRASGAVHEAVKSARHMLTEEEVPDQTLEARIRSELGRTVSYVGAINVIAEDGTVTLEGDVLADDVNDVMSTTASVSGVKSVVDHLHVHENASNIPALQGKRQR